MHYKFLVLATLLCGSFLRAQNSDIRWGKQEEAGSRNDSYIPLGWVEGHYYAVQLDGSDGLLLDIDKDMNIASQKELISGQKKFDADQMYIRNGQLFQLASEYESGEKTNYVRATNFSLLGKVSGIKLKKVAAVKVTKNSEKSDFQYFFSADSSVLLIVHEHDMPGSDNAKVTFTVSKTEDFGNMWSDVFDFSYESKNFKVLGATVDNSGKVLMIASIKGDEGKRLERYSTHMFAFSGTGSKYEEKTMKMEGKFISSVRVLFLQNGKAMVSGFYNDLKDNGKNEGIEGAFVAINDAGKLGDLELKTYAMKPETKEAIVPTSGLAKLFGTDELNAYILRDMKVNTDGSGYVIAEQRYIVQSDNGSSMQRTYYFNHLIIFRFDDNQDIQWMSAIPKQQLSSVATPKIGIGPLSFWYFTGAMVRSAFKYNSFVSIDKNDNIYILYNDNKDNGDARTLKETKPMMNKNKALATLVTVAKDGDWSKIPLFRGKDLDVIMETSSCFPMAGKGFTISAERGKNLQFGMLDL